MTGRETMMLEDCQVIASNFRFTECPRWHDETLFFVDMHDRRVCRLAADGSVETVVEVEHPGGIGWLPDGHLLVAACYDRQILRFDGAQLHVHADLTGQKISIVNDMVVGKSGCAFIGSLGEGFADGLLPPVPIFRVTSDGAVHVAADGLYGPNGMALTPDGKTLIVAESFASRLTAFDIDAEGELSNRRTWAALGEGVAISVSAVLQTDEVIPDGIALGAEGTVWVADARGGGALRVAEGGRIIERRTFGSETAIAVALGPGDATLYAMVGPPFREMAGIFATEERRYSIWACRLDAGG